MSKDEMRAEKLYQTTMHMARNMLAGGIITETEYSELEQHFVSKYSPTFGVLFSALSLDCKGLQSDE